MINIVSVRVGPWVIWVSCIAGYHKIRRIGSSCLSDPNLSFLFELAFDRYPWYFKYWQFELSFVFLPQQFPVCRCPGLPCFLPPPLGGFVST